MTVVLAHEQETKERNQQKDRIRKQEINQIAKNAKKQNPFSFFLQNKNMSGSGDVVSAPK